jgi:hypothetical protein
VNAHSALSTTRRRPVLTSFQQYGTIFKIPTSTGWMVVISGAEKVDEFRKAPDGIVSQLEAQNEVCYFYPLARNLLRNTL